MGSAVHPSPESPSVNATALILLAVPVFAADPKIHRDVPYAESADARQTLDLYAPAEGTKHPVMFWIHGGGWQHGDKSEADHKPQSFVDRGFVFVSTNYRLLPDATIQAMAEDVAKAFRWTYDHAEEYGGDRERIFVMGHSAGAQLAALICTDDRYLAAEGLSLSNVRGCVPVDGDTYDVPLQIATVSQSTADIYRRKFGDEASQRELSPISHVAAGKRIPPVLILHVAEHPETELQSKRLVEELQGADVPASTYAAADTDHVKLNADLGLPDDKPTAVLFEFLDGLLKRDP